MAVAAVNPRRGVGSRPGGRSPGRDPRWAGRLEATRLVQADDLGEGDAGADLFPRPTLEVKAPEAGGADDVERLAVFRPGDRRLALGDIGEKLEVRAVAVDEADVLQGRMEGSRSS